MLVWFAVLRREGLCEQHSLEGETQRLGSAAASPAGRSGAACPYTGERRSGRFWRQPTHPLAVLRLEVLLVRAIRACEPRHDEALVQARGDSSVLEASGGRHLGAGGAAVVRRRASERGTQGRQRRAGELDLGSRHESRGLMSKTIKIDN